MNFKIVTLSIICFMILSCATTKTSAVKDNKLFVAPSTKTYDVIGAIQVSKLYFDPFGSEAGFETNATAVLNRIVPDLLYELRGDYCWITNFNLISNSYKCGWLCSEVVFDIVALKEK